MKTLREDFASAISKMKPGKDVEVGEKKPEIQPDQWREPVEHVLPIKNLCPGIIEWATKTRQKRPQTFILQIVDDPVYKVTGDGDWAVFKVTEPKYMGATANTWSVRLDKEFHRMHDAEMEWYAPEVPVPMERDVILACMDLGFYRKPSLWIYTSIYEEAFTGGEETALPFKDLTREELDAIYEIRHSITYRRKLDPAMRDRLVAKGWLNKNKSWTIKAQSTFKSKSRELADWVHQILGKWL